MVTGKKPSFWIAVSCVIVCAGLAVCFLLNLTGRKNEISLENVSFRPACEFLEIKNVRVTSTAIEVKIKNNSESEFTFGAGYSLLRDGNLTETSQNMNFIALGYVLKPHETQDILFPLEPFAKELKQPGSYVFEKQFAHAGSQERYTLCAAIS